ncbi:Rpn family recombination-promoting nuclease/putative transposase [Klebsiella michiganensis]|uniref:Rpn family recombination-promoting nuclease/putative transposase n=1 Tax=Klebsiella michiganensis TaxID=1134687 RepID=UPI003983071A
MTTQSSPTPHDAIFKQLLAHIDTARDFIDIHLPADLRSLCDLNTLQLESGSFIEEDLRAYYSDVLYSLEINNKTGYIHVLIEHQSSPDKQMPFRLMRYSVAAMQHHLEAGPLVVPILFYQGKTSPYPFSMNWYSMFDLPEWAKIIYNRPFPLVDITVIPDNAIMQHRRIAILELLQKHIRQRDLMLLLEQLGILLNAGYTTAEQLKVLFSYMGQRGHTENPKAFFNGLVSHIPQEESMETLDEWLEKNGKELFIEWGQEKGEAKARLKIANRMLENGMERSLVIQLTEVTENELEQLQNSTVSPN